MDANKIIKVLQHHPLMVKDVTNQMQYGLPMLERKNGRILLTFYLHEEKLTDNGYAFYPAAYKASFDIPSLRVIEFRNLVVSDGADCKEPVRVLSQDFILGQGREIIAELYNWLGTTLDKLYLPETDGDPVEQYNELFRAAAADLGLEKLYLAV